MFRMSRLFTLLNSWEKWAVSDGKIPIREQQRNPTFSFAPGLEYFYEFRREWQYMPMGADVPSPAQENLSDVPSLA